MPGPQQSHDRYLAKQLTDPVFAAEYERHKREIETIDNIVNTLDELRNERGLSKAGLARTIGKHPASVRRLLTAGGNPELRTVVAIAEALGAELRVAPRSAVTQVDCADSTVTQPAVASDAHASPASRR